MDQRTDGPTDQQMDRQTDGPTDQRTDRPSYKDARTLLIIDEKAKMGDNF